MMVRIGLGWVFIALGVLFEMHNLYYAVSWLREERPKSSVLGVPFLLIAAGALIGVFSSKWAIITVALCIHVVLAVIIPWCGGAYRYTPEERGQWLRKRKQ